MVDIITIRVFKRAFVALVAPTSGPVLAFASC